MFTVQVTAPDFPDLIPSVIHEIQVEMKHQLVEIQKLARNEHRYGKPYSRGYQRTGNLAQSVQTEVTDDGMTGAVGFDPGLPGARYAPYVHEGHGARGRSVKKGYPYVWQPDRFLDAAIQKREPAIKDGFEKAIQRGLTKGGSIL